MAAEKNIPDRMIEPIPSLSERMLHQTVMAVVVAARESPDPTGAVYDLLKAWIDGKDKMIDHLVKQAENLVRLLPPAPIIIAKKNVEPDLYDPWTDPGWDAADDPSFEGLQ